MSGSRNRSVREEDGLRFLKNREDAVELLERWIGAKTRRRLGNPGEWSVQD